MLLSEVTLKCVHAVFWWHQGGQNPKCSPKLPNENIGKWRGAPSQSVRPRAAKPGRPYGVMLSSSAWRTPSPWPWQDMITWQVVGCYLTISRYEAITRPLRWRIELVLQSLEGVEHVKHYIDDCHKKVVQDKQLLSRWTTLLAQGGFDPDLSHRDATRL